MVSMFAACHVPRKSSLSGPKVLSRMLGSMSWAHLRNSKGVICFSAGGPNDVSSKEAELVPGKIKKIWNLKTMSG